MNELNRQPLSSFYQLFTQPISHSNLEDLKQLSVAEHDCLNSVLKGGYPEPIQQENDLAFQVWMENYHKTYIATDIKRLYPKLNDLKFRRFISILTSLSGTIINKAQVGRSLDTSEVTVRDYLEIADKTFIWRSIPSYENSKIKSIVKMPKGIFRKL